MITPALLKAPFQVNTTDGGLTQFHGRVAAAPDGTYYAAWVDLSGGGNFIGRHFAADGSPLSGELVLGSGSNGGETAVLQNGNVAALVTSPNGGGQNTYLNIFNSTLSAPVSYTIDGTASPTTNPEITVFSDNGVFVSYGFADGTVMGRFLNSAGVLGAPITMIDTSAQASNVHLATLDNGNFVVTFQAKAPLGGSTFDVIEFQIRSEDGTLVKPTSFVVSPGGVNILQPEVAALHTGGFVVVSTASSQFSSGAVLATVLDSNGNIVRTASFPSN